MAKPVAIVTGAYGGMGRACSRGLGRTYRLVLADIDQGRLDQFAESLREEGYDVADVVAGDLAEPEVCGRLAAASHAAGPLAALIHTAGLSPSLAPWDAILRANVVATEHLLRALEANLPNPFAAVLLASMAGHMAPAHPEIDTAFAAPLEGDFLAGAKTLLSAGLPADDALTLATVAYSQSKRAVIRMCETRAAAWGRSGARIVSISPGIIWTPMGRKEMDSNPNASPMVDMTPVGRWGTPLDIAAAAEFLISDAAGFITGCDLRVDGGVTPSVRAMRG
jgi:NAD(P)-dependent dehydrogenase (short-subunit alcohol dehydrogenase family)